MLCEVVMLSYATFTSLVCVKLSLFLVLGSRVTKKTQVFFSKQKTDDEILTEPKMITQAQQRTLQNKLPSNEENGGNLI